MVIKSLLDRSRIPFYPSFCFTPNRGPHRKELKMGKTSGGVNYRKGKWDRMKKKLLLVCISVVFVCSASERRDKSLINFYDVCSITNRRPSNEDCSVTHVLGNKEYLLGVCDGHEGINT